MVEKIHILDLEGLAINGMVESHKLVDCEKKGKVRLTKLVAKLADGREVETDCIDYPRIVHTFIVLEKYKDWGKNLVKEEIPERVMKGITYDLHHDEG